MRYYKIGIFVLLIFVLTAIFVACGSETPASTTADTTSAQVVETTAPTTTVPTTTVPTTTAKPTTESSAVTTVPTTTIEDFYKQKLDWPEEIVPSPKQVTLGGDKGYGLFLLNPTITSEDEAFNLYLDTFIGYTQKILGATITKGNGGIVLRRDTTLSAGAYALTATKDGVTIKAADNDGITYALATLHQILEYENGELCVPAYTIYDRPDSSYRTLMVDLARKFHTLDQVLDYIDLCYLYKIKFLHLHFTDKEAYRLPSEAFPKLTSSQGYSKEDIAKLNQYALERNIEIIPEIDLPGHAISITTAYPDLFGHTATYGSVTNEVVCIGKPEFFDNLQIIFDEIAAMFPNSRYLHIGGDEADFSTLTNCSDCGQFIFDHDITSLKMFYTYFIKLATEMVLDMGKTPIVWEGFPKEGAEMISRDILVTGWESLYHLPDDLVAEGFTVTNSSWLPLYIIPAGINSSVPTGRWQPEDILKWNPYTWRNWWSSSPASKNPIVVAPTDQVVGGSLCAWETTYAQDITPIKENLAALSERLWNVNAKITVSEYMKALNKLYAMADKVIGD